MSTSQHTGKVPMWTQSDRLRKAREAADLEQGQLAKLIGVSQKTISNAEAGRHGVRRIIVVRAWALATGVPVAWLLTGQAPSDDGPTSGGPVTACYRTEMRLSGIRDARSVTQIAPVVPVRAVAA